MSIQSNKRYLFFNSPEYIDENINILPPQIRNKLYIICMRNFWRKYIPFTAKVPSWYRPSIIHKNILFNAQQNNIHFLHLSCNTLDEHKKYIMGCQCKFCLHDVSEKHKEQLRQDGIMISFHKNISETESKWNNTYEYIYDWDTGNMLQGLSIFNPFYDVCENIVDTINGYPIHFKP